MNACSNALRLTSNNNALRESQGVFIRVTEVARPEITNALDREQVLQSGLEHAIERISKERIGAQFPVQLIPLGVTGQRLWYKKRIAVCT